jgi:hypothetical protein
MWQRAYGNRVEKIKTFIETASLLTSGLNSANEYYMQPNETFLGQ